MSFHEKISALGSRLGYFDRNSEDFTGLCHGFTFRWLEAVLSHQISEFSTCIEKIEETEPERVVDATQTVKTKVQNKEKLSKEDKEWLDVLAFYESLTLYHFPDLLYDLFNQSVSQGETEKITKFASSVAMQKQGGFVELGRNIDFYLEQVSLGTYIEELQSKLTKANACADGLVGFTLHSINHVIGLMFDGNTWVCMDINQGVAASLDASVIASFIRTGFGNANVITTRLFCLNAHPQQQILHEILISIQEASLKHLVENSSMINTNFIMRLVEYGFGGFISALFDCDVNFDVIDSRGFTPIFFAAQRGNAKIVEILAQQKVDVNQAAPDGITPFMSAAEGGYLEVLEVLAGIKSVDFKKTRGDGTGPAHAAVYFGDLSINLCK